MKEQLFNEIFIFLSFPIQKHFCYFFVFISFCFLTKLVIKNYLSSVPKTLFLEKKQNQKKQVKFIFRKNRN